MILFSRETNNVLVVFCCTATLVNGHCQTEKFELRVLSRKLSAYKIGMVIEALACRHRTISRCLLVKLAYKSICVHDQITILDLLLDAPKCYYLLVIQARLVTCHVI